MSKFDSADVDDWVGYGKSGLFVHKPKSTRSICVRCEKKSEMKDGEEIVVPFTYRRGVYKVTLENIGYCSQCLNTFHEIVKAWLNGKECKLERA